MRLLRVIIAVLLGATTLCAQAPRVNPERAPETPEQIIAANSARYDYRPDITILTQMVRALQPAAKVSAEGKALVDKLTQEAAVFQKQGNNGDARRRLSQAIALQLGRSWNPKEEFNASLVLRTDMTVADTARPFIAQLAQRYPASYSPVGAFKLRVSLAEGGLPGRADVVVAGGKVLQEIGNFDLPLRDLIDDPYRFSANLEKVPEGAYLVVAEVLDGGASVGRMVAPVYLVRDFEARRTAIEQRLSKIQGHDSAKATVRFPWDLARGINAANREVNAFDFGEAVRRSEALLKSLEAGKDPLYQAKGDNKRNYYFTEVGEIMPYRLFVPSTWAPGKKLPMILALHGSQLDENNFITRADGELCKQAEKHGYIIAAPLGYRINGGYGRISVTPGARPDPVAVRIAQMSDLDAMNVMEIVATEYNVDRSRVYITGNSMGGNGTWLLGAKYAEKFAGMAPCANGTPATVADYPMDRLKGMPILAVVGTLDTGFLQPMRDSITKLKERGIDAQLVEVQGGTHSTAVEEMLPQIVEFFNSHQRKVSP